MFAIKTLAATATATAAALSLALTAHTADAWNGQVTFYEDAYFQGGTFTVGISTTQRCFNIGCFNDRASSVTWNNLIQSGSYDGGYSYIVFYTDINCGGDSRSWRIADNNFPQNFEIDGINDAVTSFMIWENSPFATQGTNTVCPFAPLAESGLLTVNQLNSVNTNSNNAITAATEAQGVLAPATMESLLTATQQMHKAIGEK